MGKKKAQDEQKEHVIGAIRTYYEVECGHCKHRWQEHSTNELRNNFDPGLQEGVYLCCPKCDEELSTKIEYRGDM